ncbi:hypothetical protein Zm00014a_013346 [Zea mays]|jgi:hypothetical protein|uniref:C2 NT-type domain-containing protein n=1 Tax=Zea mays TaxID=4577 RepID=A0A3L6G2A3_MAIZE|nr:hypothetical protein Zm00014a_013346 [Zea mays]
MAGSRAQPSLELSVRVVRVDGLDQEQLERGGTLFLRYYVPAGDGRRRLRVDTREVPCGGDLRWGGELARFERRGGSSGTGGAAPAGGIAFELRWRPRPSSSGLAALLGAGARARRPSSRLLARAELPWADVSSSRPAERWLTLSLSQVGRDRELGGCKAPKLLVEAEAVHAVADAQVTTGRTPGGVPPECCRAGERCSQCGWIGFGSEEDMFLAATFSH